MKIYKVGGAVRDRLLGLPVKDVDWVVVGADAAQMEAQGFRPVGKDFPVFLHPRTQEEYALARTERKSGRGYKGFTVFADPSVTLAEDLARRDLTINAMAEDEQGNVIDPFGGRDDLRDRLLRHVSPAFAEDPVRILRLARFAARFGFAVAPETLALMQGMVTDGEADHLVAERVWQELARGLMEARPSAMFDVLRRCGALARVAPELDALWHAPEVGERVMRVLDYTAAQEQSLAIRYASLCARLGDGEAAQGETVLVEALSKRLRAPSECRDLALMARRERQTIHHAPTLDADALLALFGRTDALRKPERFAQLLDVCAADLRADDATLAYLQAAHLLRLLDAARGVDAGAVAKACPDPSQIPARVAQARRAAILAAL